MAPMPTTQQDHYPDCPEAFIVGLARSGDAHAFEELVRRRQSSIRVRRQTILD